jgi:hypothetical protein
MRYSKPKYVLFILVAVGGAIFIAALVAEVFLRLCGPLRTHATTVAHPTLHHAHRPGASILYGIPGGEYEPVIMHFDTQGARRPSASVSDESSKPFRLAVLGDSFVEAAQVTWEHSFTGMLAAKYSATTAVRNFGTASYSPLLSLLQWRQIIVAWRPTHVLYLSYENDFGGLENPLSDTSYMQDATRSPEGEIIAIQAQHSWPRQIMDRSYLRWELLKGWRALQNKLNHDATSANGTNPHPAAPQIQEPSTGLILTLRREVEASGGQFFQAAVPCKSRHMQAEVSQTSLEAAFAAKLMHWAVSEGIDFIDLDPVFADAARRGEPLFFKQDIHFNQKGHAAAFQCFVSRLDAELLAPPKTLPKR